MILCQTQKIGGKSGSAKLRGLRGLRGVVGDLDQIVAWVASFINFSRGSVNL